MALIGWSHIAKKQLVDIYTYYSTTANENIANSFWSIIEEGTANYIKTNPAGVACASDHRG